MRARLPSQRMHNVPRFFSARSSMRSLASAKSLSFFACSLLFFAPGRPGAKDIVPSELLRPLREGSRPGRSWGRTKFQGGPEFSLVEGREILKFHPAKRITLGGTWTGRRGKSSVGRAIWHVHDALGRLRCASFSFYAARRPRVSVVAAPRFPCYARHCPCALRR